MKYGQKLPAKSAIFRSSMNSSPLKPLKSQVVEILLELREEFTKDIVDAEKNGGGHYNNETFDSLDEFMVWMEDKYVH